MDKPKHKLVKYLDYRKVIEYLETISPGIGDRLKMFRSHLKNDHQQLTNDSLIHVNLFYYGPRKDDDKTGYEGVFDWIEETGVEQERNDFHLIWTEFEDQIDDIEFAYFYFNW